MQRDDLSEAYTYMGSVIELNQYRPKGLSSDCGAVRDVRDCRKAMAYEMILKASCMLSAIGEKERRIAWILEDCVELLQERGPAEKKR